MEKDRDESNRINPLLLSHRPIASQGAVPMGFAPRGSPFANHHQSRVFSPAYPGSACSRIIEVKDFKTSSTVARCICREVNETARKETISDKWKTETTHTQLLWSLRWREEIER